MGHTGRRRGVRRRVSGLCFGCPAAGFRAVIEAEHGVFAHRFLLFLHHENDVLVIGFVELGLERVRGRLPDKYEYPCRSSVL